MLSPIFGPVRENHHIGGLDIVVVPAIGLNQPSQWVDSTGASWLQKLAENVGSETIVWQFSHSLDRQGSLAQQLLLEGHGLVEALHSHCIQNPQRKFPIVFVCHGTGGFILKKALCICRDQAFRLLPVIDVVSGFVFLGAPHLVGDVEDAKRTFDHLLKCQNKGIGRSVSSKDDVEELVRICRSFELLNLLAPVVSAFESKETLTTYSRFSKFRSKGRGQMIVTAPIATLKAEGEVIVDSESDHFEICNVPVGGPVFKASQDLVRKVMAHAPQRIAEANQPYPVPLALKDDTLRSASTAGWTRVEDQLSEKISEYASTPISTSRRVATGQSSGSSFEFVPAETALEITSRDPILPCFMLGTRCKPTQFIGREDVLREIDHHLHPKLANTRKSETPSQLRSFAVCGLGGMGKTELVTEYAYSRRKDFEAIFWLNADKAEILAANFAQIAIQLGLEVDESPDYAASRDIAMAWLSEPLKKSSEPDTPENTVNWLIVFDNVDNLDVLSEYWPKLGRGSVLVTSRDPLAKNNIFVDDGINLPRLSGPESEALMQKLTQVKASNFQKQALSTIAKKLDGLPLAIKQMAGVFKDLRLSYTDFLRYFEDEGIEKIFERRMDLDNDEESQSLTTFWNLDRLSPNTKALLQVLCLLDPDEIPEYFLVDKRGEVLLYSYPRSTDEYFRARKELISTFLISQSEDQSNIYLHRLVQDTARGMMDQEGLMAATQSALSLMISAWPFQNMKEHHSVARFTRCEALFPSVLRLRSGVESLIQENPNFHLDIRVARLFNDVGWYMFERGLPEDTKPFCELGLLIGHRLKSSLGEQAIESIRESHSFLGIALAETNEHSLSMSHKQKWLDLLLERRTDGGLLVEDYELGYAYNEVGVAYGNENALDKAVAAFYRSINVFQGLDDYDDTMLGWPEPNLGFMYWLQGDLGQAEQALVEILDIHATAWGVDDTKSFKTGKILYGIGNVLESQGRFEESLGFHRRCLEQFKKVLGMNHHRFGDICHRMAGHCMRQRLYIDAERYLDMAIRIFNARPYLMNELARTTFKKGKLYRLNGLNAKADQVFAKAYELRKALVPWDSRHVEQLTERDFDNLVAFWSR